MLNVTEAIDVKLSVLPDSVRTIKNGSELHFYHGAMTLLAKVFLLDSKELLSGESCYARLKFKEPLPCKRGDRFVVRFYSPIETIGGGKILDSMPKSRISRGETAIAALKIRESGNSVDIANLAANELGRVFSEIDLCKRADLDRSTCSSAIEGLIANGDIEKLQSDKYVSCKVLEKLSNECTTILKNYHQTNPLRAGMNIAELRQKLLPSTDKADANALLAALNKMGALDIDDKNVSLPGLTIEYTSAQREIHDRIISELAAAGYDVPTPDELSESFTKKEKREFEQVLESIISNGELVMLSPQVFWLKDVYNKAITLIREHFEKNEEITLAECRDMLKTSRKYALTFLEHLDGKQSTKLHGDARKPNKGI
jgi:selenocysteine-specific elongation factor